ncbi:HEAT repeat-containing protein 2, partial [Stegodyphus mimosarum]
MATTEVIGDWLLTFKDRYSFFHYLIPLMLSALHDYVPDIRLKASDLWKKCGEQYLSENENDYKDLIDFPRPEPENYPDPGNRPLVGCRILVQRNLPKILPALLNDLADWVPETRIKSSKVLYSLILHSEDKATMHLSSIIEGIISIAKDEVKEAAEQALRSAELLGFFIDANLLCDSIMVLIHKTPSSVHLSVFAAVLRGHKGKLSKDCFAGICKFLSNPLVCRVRKAEEQANLLLCIEGLFASHNDINPIISYQIFTTLMSVSGLTTSDVISKKAADLMEGLANLQECSCKSLYEMHSTSLLKIITANNELWTYQNPELFIFESLVQSGNLEEEAIELIIPVLTNNLHPSKDAKLRSKILSLLIEIFKKFSTKDEKISGKIMDLIREGLFPNLTWAPGKTASTLRTIAGASLYEILSKNCLTHAMLKPIANELLSILATLADDDETSNRLLAGKIFENILPKLHTCVDENKIHATCHEFLPCMDDESDDIRMLTSGILKTYIKSFPKDYNWQMYRAHLKHIYETVVIHMDDKNEKIRLRILSFLKEVAFAASDLLLNELESKKYMMEAGDLCDNLIEHIRSLNVKDV